MDQILEKRHLMTGKRTRLVVLLLKRFSEISRRSAQILRKQRSKIMLFSFYFFATTRNFSKTLKLPHNHAEICITQVQYGFDQFLAK